MRTLLVNYSNDNSAAESWFPQGLAHIASGLHKTTPKAEVSVLDLNIIHDNRVLKTWLDLWEWDIIGLSFIGGYWQYRQFKELMAIINAHPRRSKIYVMAGGHLFAPNPSYFFNKFGVDCVVLGDGENIREVIEKQPRGLYYPKLLDIDTIPWPAYDMFDISHYRLLRMPNCSKTDYCLPVLSSRGCPFRCLSGDTEIETIMGLIPIKRLVGMKAKVLTRDKTGNILYASSGPITKTGKNEKLVRVHFDDGTHIDCTPDHRFLTFKNSNQFVSKRERETEAQNLKPKDSVVAIKWSIDAFGYEVVSWGRKKRIKAHRLIMQGLLGRKLKKTECVHHLNGDKSDNKLDNILLLDSVRDHSFFHPEIAERMHRENPAKNMNPEWAAKIREANTGKHRTLEQRIHYRESKLGKKNPNYKHGKTVGHTRINHKIIEVEELPGLHDTYCMEVPGYNWFFANNVLVHNCNFCYRMDKHIRMRHVEALVDELKFLMRTYRISYFAFADELLMMSEKRAIEVSEALMPLGVKWDCNGRLNYAKPEVLEVMKRAGCVFINYGIEAFDDKVLENMHKRLDCDIIVKGVEATLAAGISPGLNLIWGNIGDNSATLNQAVDFLLRYDDYAQLRTIRPVTPYPGSQLFDEAIKRGLVDNFEDFYEKKHVNSDLFSCNFLNMTNEEAHRYLFEANARLLEHYHERVRVKYQQQLVDLYLRQDKNFRGFRTR